MVPDCEQKWQSLFRFGAVQGIGRCDLYCSKLVDGQYGPPENLGEPINSAANEVEPFIAPDKSYLIFAGTGLPESKGAYDLYVSLRQNGTWTRPRHLGDKINSVGWDFSPKVSADEKWFFFTSTRSFADKPLEKRLTYAELLKNCTVRATACAIFTRSTLAL
jgi:WD40-like Beta Propeller Repeat